MQALKLSMMYRRQHMQLKTQSQTQLLLQSTKAGWQLTRRTMQHSLPNMRPLMACMMLLTLLLALHSALAMLLTMHGQVPRTPCMTNSVMSSKSCMLWASCRACARAVSCLASIAMTGSLVVLTAAQRCLLMLLAELSCRLTVLRN
jgi:hypothetical protein